MKLFSLLFLCGLFITPALAFVHLKSEIHDQTLGEHTALSYDEARVRLFNEIYLEMDKGGYFVTDVYCDHKYYHYLPGQTPGTRLPSNLNTEHTWPQSKFSNKYPKPTQKSDLHHLFPTLTKINAERGNLPFAEVNAEGELDLSCHESHMGTNTETNDGTYFEPPQEHKGNVARAMFYFSVRYEINIDPVQEFFFRQWHILDPVDAMEKKRHEIIYKIQHNRNPFIDQPELVNQVADF